MACYRVQRLNIYIYRENDLSKLRHSLEPLRPKREREKRTTKAREKGQRGDSLQVCSKYTCEDSSRKAEKHWSLVILMKLNTADS